MCFILFVTSLLFPCTELPPSSSFFVLSACSTGPHSINSSSSSDNIYYYSLFSHILDLFYSKRARNTFRNGRATERVLKKRVLVLAQDGVLHAPSWMWVCTCFNSWSCLSGPALLVFSPPAQASRNAGEKDHVKLTLNALISCHSTRTPTDN